MNEPETKVAQAEAADDERTTVVFDRWLKPGETYQITLDGVEYTAIYMDPADPVNRPILDWGGFIYHWETPPSGKVYRSVSKLVAAPLPDPWIMPDDGEEGGE